MEGSTVSNFYKIKFRHPQVPGKFFVVVTEITEQHEKSIEKLTKKHNITRDEGMEIAAVMNVVLHHPEFVPDEVLKITEKQYEELVTQHSPQ